MMCIRGKSVPAAAPAAAILLGAALGAPASGKVLLNEIAIQGTERVEFFNSGPDTVSLNGWTINGSGSYQIGDTTPVPPGEYLVIDPPGDIFDDQGGYIELLEVAPEDGVYYGGAGSAPLPPDAVFPRGFAPGASLARAPDASLLGAPPSPSPSSDGTFWTIDTTPTFGSVNDVAASALGTSLRLNEFDPKPVGGGDGVELYNPFAATIDVTGWYLTNGDVFFALTGGVPGAGFRTFAMPPGFDLEENDLVYLFRDDHVRVDQAGFGLPPVRAPSPTLDFCQCYARFTDGAGPSNGWDWLSSGGDVTLIELLCTPNASNALVESCAATGAEEPRSSTWTRIKARWR